MNTTAPEIDGRRRRRRHSPEFKAESIAACQQVGVSIAAVALSRGLNANMLRLWVAEAERGGAPARVKNAASFLPVPLPTPAAAAPAASADIRIELRRGAATVHVVWPREAAADCAAWLAQWLR